MSKHLTPLQIEHFNQQGYAFPFRALSAEDAALYRSRIEAYETHVGADANLSLKIKAHLVSPAFVELARNPRILDAVEDVIGPDILLFGASVFAKNAHDPRYVSWHQDSTYFGLSPHEEVTVWVGFTDATPENGCLRVLPGSHREPDYLHQETFAKDNMLAKGQSLIGVDDSRGVEMPLSAGEFSIHHERTAHSSRANTTDDRRIGFAFFYIPTHVSSTIGRRRATLVRGEDRYGHWDAEALPGCDYDPASMAQLHQAWGQYRDGEVKGG
ncbi:phytanoyl-CoA dioxygenase family protein [Pseudomonas sp. GD03842]|uniref:phytanoyl-CoA dioxygenase family protein n=1 Tax=Pseudomonas sp. GD03842 TaxID=2975385 RepID=UPI002446E786|nr:phytanoyl-CoA dioxygenase family protein [Pseudomonas sp. GD03842]MDH0745179.1 phytanoyl-CoA dioxygenase family protein [Pseudomonas sp. GD03842]